MIVVRRLPSSVKQIGPRKAVGILSPAKTMSSGQQLPTSSQPPSTSNVSSSSSAPRATSTTGEGGTTSVPFDFNSAFNVENKKRTIETLTLDRENSMANAVWDDLNSPEYRRAAVLIPLCYDLKGQPCILYNLRASTLSKHKGEISFPGGSFDPEDNNNPVTAALRETHEELGIPPNAVDVWTVLRLFPTIQTALKVIPVLGFVKTGPVDAKKLEINPDEVDHAFTVSLEHLCNSNNWGSGTMRRHKGKEYLMPQWNNLQVFNGSSEEIKLWGLTAFITHLTLSALLPKEVYTRSIPYIELDLSKNQKSDPNDSSKNSKGGSGKL